MAYSFVEFFPGIPVCVSVSIFVSYVSYLARFLLFFFILSDFFILFYFIIIP